MSVLARLALRALGTPSPVRPRLGGLFERDAGAAESSTPPTQATGPTALSIPVLDLAPPRASSDDQAPESPRAPTAPAENAPQTLRRHAPPQPPALFGEPIPSSPEPAAREVDAGVDRTVIRAGVDRSAPVAAIPGSAPERPLDRAPAPEPPVVHLPPLAEPGRPAAPYQPLFPPLRGERPLPAARPAAPPEPPAEPDVHISIGRIEVRGEPESHRPAAPQRSGAKLMSLEEYIGRGRRR